MSRVTRDERFETQVKRYKPRWWHKFRYCGKCRDEVYKEDMWRRRESGMAGSFVAHVCDTCCTSFEEAVDYFKKRVNF
jgi:hypothetical protein